ncbi:HET-domain-containing protein, partial [Lojkania enalia]
MSSDGNPTFKWQLSFSAATPSRGFIFGIHFFCAPYNAKLSSYAPLVRSPIIRTTGVDFSSARRWLTQCLEDHKMCTSTHDHQAVLPSRLIKVWQENKLIRARLVEKEEIQTGCQYVTLSYRWVRGETFLLQGNCLSDLKREIPISQLPRRFLEALEIVLHLGYSYLWLDAICVLQDSPSDWEHEASRMADVYENAVFNIAATAPDVTHSSFFPSNFTKNRKPLTVPVKIQVTDGCLVGVYSIVQNDFWRVRVDEAPLNRRAWVLQERFFSPRILYLGSDQLLWECQELQASDAFATGIPQGMYNIRAMGYRPYRTIMKTYPDLAHEITKHTWYQIIRDYTCSDLTFPSDKLFAIAGIIKKFEVILYDKCIAGLWKKTFIQDLLWCRGFLVKDFPRPIDDRAPTWSWACLDCEIYFP